MPVYQTNQGNVNASNQQGNSAGLGGVINWLTQFGINLI
jgi:hypothetical protein